MRSTWFLIAAFWLFFICACPARECVRLTENQLMNTGYSGFEEGDLPGKPIVLAGGIYREEPFVTGGMVRHMISIIRGSQVYGDMDGDGTEDAAVLLVEDSGGTGRFTYIGVQFNRMGQPEDGGAVLLGDRVQIISLVIENRKMLIDMVIADKDEPHCCGTLKVRKIFEMKGGVLMEVNSAYLGKVSFNEINNKRWKFQSVSCNPTLQRDAVITLHFTGDRIYVASECGTYHAEMIPGTGQELSIGPLKFDTEEFCAGGVRKREKICLAFLARTKKWFYSIPFGSVSLVFEMKDDVLGHIVLTEFP